MAGELNKPAICVVGPTASGKTALTQVLAERLSGAVLSADSMQVYTGMDIGTSKIPPKERSVEYFGLDLVSPGEPYSAALFQAYGRKIIEERDAQHAWTIVCGGTGFYIRALIDDFVFPCGAQTENPVREHYLTVAKERGAEAVWNILHDCDAASADCIPVQDTKRVIRALEMYEEGISYAEQKDAFTTIAPYYSAVQIGLKVDTDVLNKRINARVDAMIEEGLLAEVETLLSQGYRDAITANQAIGYKELVRHLDGECSLDDALEQIKLATRRYAKRQRTWFRKDARIHWLEATDFNLDKLLDEALTYINEVAFV